MRRVRVTELHFYEWRASTWAVSETRDRLDAAGRGIYRELIDQCYTQGKFPDDAEWICRKCACTNEQYEKAWAHIVRHFPISATAGYRWNVQANIVRHEYFDYVDKQREYGKRSAPRKAIEISNEDRVATAKYGIASGNPQGEPQPNGNGNGNGNGKYKENTLAPCGASLSNPLLALGWMGGLKWVKHASDEMCQKIWEMRERDFEPSEDTDSPIKIWAHVNWFEEFWMCYWLLKGKKRARELYFSLVPTLEVHEKIMTAVEAQTAEMLARPEDKRPHATTWLNGARWNDQTSSPSAETIQ